MTGQDSNIFNFNFFWLYQLYCLSLMRKLFVTLCLERTGTYIHNWPLPPFSQEYGLLTPIMLCMLILHVSGGTYSLTLTPNDRFLRNFFMTSLLTLRVFARNLLRENGRKNIFFFFIFRFDA